MTRTTHARIAGVAFLFYIAVGLPATILFGRAVGGGVAAADITEIARHTGELRVSILLSLLCCFSAVTLAVTLYAITRDVDRDLAMMVMALRLGEGVLGAASLPSMLGLLSLATAGSGAGAFDADTANKFGAFLLMPDTSTGANAIFFATASTIFSYLLLRGRLVPAALAWLGVVASAILVVGLPLQLVGLIHGPVLMLMWLPMLAFELPLAVWLLLKGVAPPAAR